MESLQKYIKEERPQLEKDGWRFVSIEELNSMEIEKFYISGEKYG
jgi:hypothetical protein